jgi:UDP-N-acetylglucosamine 2-epimerase (non-hydrolysing)/GDP/UDP-N,N'-diacetylbacillosamine 2-epimerase (hydrolysing)
MRKRKICVITTSRADYGLLYWLMKEIQSDCELVLQVIAAGMHLEPGFGLTYKAISEDGFKITEKIRLSMKDDTEIGISKSIGIGFKKFAMTYEKLRPDVIVLLGDRYELLSAAVPALVSKIPLAHIHGGETTQGAIDEAVRHCITKMSIVHFVSTEIYRKRIVQMGEDPKFVFNYGAPGLDNLHRLRLLNKKKLQEELDFDLHGETAIITCHPATLEKYSPGDQIDNLLKALKAYDFKAVFTMANADVGGRTINREIEKFCRAEPGKYKFFRNLGQVAYLSCLKNFDIMVGNSSSGIIEAPSFKLPVVNIGDRQKGRVRAKNVIDVGYSKSSIEKGVKKALSRAFRNTIRYVKNPYDRYSDGKTGYRIKQKLKKLKLDGDLVKKKFHDL